MSYVPSPVCSSFSHPGRHSEMRCASVRNSHTASGSIFSNANCPSIFISAGAFHRGLNRSTGVDTREVQTVIGGRMNIVESDNAVAHMPARVSQQVRCRPLTLQRGFSFSSAECTAADTCDSDRDVRQQTRSVELDNGGNPAYRKAGGPLSHLQVDTAGFARFHRKLNFAHDFVRFERRGHHVDEELRCGNPTFAVWAKRDDGRIESKNARRIICCRIGMSNAASDGAF